MFFNLWELFVYTYAAMIGVSYLQMWFIDKSLEDIKKTGLFVTAVVEWNRSDPTNKLWINSNNVSPKRMRHALTAAPRQQARRTTCSENII